MRLHCGVSADGLEAPKAAEEKNDADHDRAEEPVGCAQARRHSFPGAPLDAPNSLQNSVLTRILAVKPKLVKYLGVGGPRLARNIANPPA
jgi:hypothetical protein